MYASTQNHPVTYASLFRSCGRIGGIIVMVSWIALVIDEAFRHGAPVRGEYLQAATLFTVFAGYVVGWRKEMFGGFLAVAGTVALYALCLGTTGVAPPPQGLFLAAPGVFLLPGPICGQASQLAELRYSHESQKHSISDGLLQIQ